MKLNKYVVSAPEELYFKFYFNSLKCKQAHG